MFIIIDINNLKYINNYHPSKFQFNKHVLNNVLNDLFECGEKLENCYIIFFFK